MCTDRLLTEDGIHTRQRQRILSLLKGASSEPSYRHWFLFYNSRAYLCYVLYHARIGFVLRFLDIKQLSSSTSPKVRIRYHFFTSHQIWFTHDGRALNVKRASNTTCARYQNSGDAVELTPALRMAVRKMTALQLRRIRRKDPLRQVLLSQVLLSLRPLQRPFFSPLQLLSLLHTLLGRPVHNPPCRHPRRSPSRIRNHHQPLGSL